MFLKKMLVAEVPSKFRIASAGVVTEFLENQSHSEESTSENFAKFLPANMQIV
jgi:hypothetical protein